MALLESGKRLTADEEVIVFRYYHEHTTPEMRNQIALNNLSVFIRITLPRFARPYSRQISW